MRTLMTRILILTAAVSSMAHAVEVCTLSSSPTSYYGDVFGFNCTTASDTIRPAGEPVSSKLRAIKTLLEKGYEIKSDTILVKP